MKRFRVNNQIRIPEVNVIDDQGKRLGIMPTFKALTLAQEKGLDLVEVNPRVRPSIVKVMDYGKYLYQKTKVEKKQKVRGKTGELKEVRFSYLTGEHDLEVKTKKIEAFFKKGHKVKICMRLRGRERSHPEMIQKKLEHFFSLIKDPYDIEQNIKRDPRGLSLVISKKKNYENK